MRIFFYKSLGENAFFWLFPTDTRPSTALAGVDGCPKPGLYLRWKLSGGCWGWGLAWLESSQAQFSALEPEPTHPGGQAAPKLGLEGSVFLLPLPAARQEVPCDQAWTAAHWASGHLLNGLWG